MGCVQWIDVLAYSKLDSLCVLLESFAELPGLEEGLRSSEG